MTNLEWIVLALSTYQIVKGLVGFSIANGEGFIVWNILESALIVLGSIVFFILY